MPANSRTDELLSLLHKACKPLSELELPVQMAAYRQLLFTAGYVDVDAMAQELGQVAEDLRDAAATTKKITNADLADWVADFERTLAGLAAAVGRAAAGLADVGKSGQER